MSRIVVFVFTIVCLAGVDASVFAQGPVRNALQELRLQRADYPGPIAYSPSDQDQRSKRLRLQTGHYGYFYNCDDEECKRNSPYICWNSQHRADWYGGWRNALRKDRRDVIQRILDGSCADGNCEQCESDQQGPTTPYYSNRGQGRNIASPQNQPARVSQRATNSPRRLPNINARSLERR